MESEKDKGLEWIRADSLVHDPRYQRPLYPAQVTKIATEFDPDLLGAIVVSERQDGKCYVIDGQHRLAGLAKMGWGDTTVPCLVHRGLTLEGEAKIFAETQSKRRQLRPTEVFRAQLLAGEPVAVGIKDTVEEVGFTLNLISGDLSNGRIGCVSAMRTVWANYVNGSDVLRATLELLRDAWGFGPGPKGTIVLGVARFVNAYRDVYDRRRAVEVMQRLFQERLNALGTEQKRVNGVNHQEGVFNVIYAAYNNRLTTHKLPDWESIKHVTYTRRGKRLHAPKNAVTTEA